MERPHEKWLDELDRGAKGTSKCSKRRGSAEDRDVWRLGIEQARLKLGRSAIEEAEVKKL
jgi:hypothetical protein